MAHCSATNRSGLPGQRLVHANGDRCTYHRSPTSPSLPRPYWFCAALNRSGRPCRRIVHAQGALCTYHQLHVEPVTPSLSFGDGPHPVDHLSPGEREALSAAASLPEPDSEIAILRILIRHAASLGDAEAARLGMETLTHLLKARHDLQQHPIDPLPAQWDQAIHDVPPPVRPHAPGTHPLADDPFYGPILTDSQGKTLDRLEPDFEGGVRDCLGEPLPAPPTPGIPR